MHFCYNINYMKLNNLYHRILTWIDRKHRTFQKFYYKDKFIDKIFLEIWKNNTWTGTESMSGPGSSLYQTRELRKILPKILKDLEIKTFLDIPCGDFSWMKHVSMNFLKEHVGADIVPQIIEKNTKLYSTKKRRFRVLDLTSDKLGKFDLIFIRDGLVHLSYEDIFRSINNLRGSKSSYLLTSTFPNTQENENIITGYWRPINLEQTPFNFPKPILVINEKCTEGNGAYRDKSMGLWRIKDLP